MIFLFSISIFAQINVKIEKNEFKIPENEENFSQAWKKIKEGDKEYVKSFTGTYLLALECYLEAQKYNSDNPELNYKIGVCYLLSLQKSKSLEYFRKSFQLKNEVAADIHLMLARGYHCNYQFDSAIVEYQIHKTAIPSENIEEFKHIEKYISECKIGKELVKTPVSVRIENIQEINSEFAEYCPLVSADEEIMIFTARKHDTQGKETDPMDKQFFEDIYISKKMSNKKWSKPLNIGEPLNTPQHDATVGFSPNGQEMLIYFEGDIFISRLNGEKWVEPEILPPTINTQYIENSACFSFDGNSIFFVSNKPDSSFGGKDIYISRKDSTGDWLPAENLGKTINTEYDEDGVFMHPDGKTLYFSSKGHNSMGGYDIFVSQLKSDNSWSEPKNLGFPVNTPDDDVYFVMSANGKRGYYASCRDGGKGFADIWVIHFFPSEKPLFRSNEDNLIACQTNPVSEITVEKADEFRNARLTIVKGKITDVNSLKPIEANIEIVDNKKNVIVATTRSNKKTGEFLITLPSGKNYGVSVKADNYLFHSENFDLDSTAAFQEITKNVQLNNFKVGAKIILKNIFFDTDKFDLCPESHRELTNLYKLLTDYPTLKIEISGHTDTQGTYEWNKTLSQNRAKAVVNYLISKGIKESRFTFRGVSYDEPISDNKTAQGRQLNRRVEFKILSK